MIARSRGLKPADDMPPGCRIVALVSPATKTPTTCTATTCTATTFTDKDASEARRVQQSVTRHHR
jgi:hypothetical protein